MCVHVTDAVLSESKGRRFSGVRSKVSLGGVHHLTVKFCNLAIRTQADVFASWSIEERTNSEEGGRLRIRERLENSWVVEGPMTAFV